MIEFWVKVWLILAVTLTVLYLIAMLVAGPEKTKSFISALIRLAPRKPNPLYLPLSSALSPLPLPLPWPSLFTGLLLLRLIEPNAVLEK
jgi:hypothetical protein